MEARKQLRIAVIVTLGVAVACVGIALVIVFTSGLGGRVGPSFSVEDRRSFPLEGVDRVSVNAVDERVRVIDSADGRFSVRLYGRARGSRDSLPRLVADVTGSTLTASVEHRPLGISPWSDLALELTVPRGYEKELSAVTVSGDVEIADHAYGALFVGTTSGTARIGAVRADSMEAHSTSGELAARSITSREASLTTVSGALRVKYQSGNLSARTTSGPINVGYGSQPGTVDITSTSGSVTLGLPAGSDFTLDARSVSGGISCAFPLTVTTHSERALEGVAGKGTAVVRIQTISGGIRITR